MRQCDQKMRTPAIFLATNSNACLLHVMPSPSLQVSQNSRPTRTSGRQAKNRTPRRAKQGVSRVAHNVAGGSLQERDLDTELRTIWVEHNQSRARPNLCAMIVLGGRNWGPSCSWLVVNKHLNVYSDSACGHRERVQGGWSRACAPQ